MAEKASTPEKVLERIEKLMMLAKDAAATPAEAAQAAFHVQRLMTEYNLSLMDIERTDASARSRMPVVEMFFTQEIGSGWKSILLEGITRKMYVKALKERSGYKLIGRSTDIKAANALYEWIMQQLSQIAANDFLIMQIIQMQTTKKLVEFTRKENNAWHEAFYRGAVSVIIERLKEILDSEEERSLVIYRGNEISQYMKDNRIQVLKSYAKAVTDLAGWNAGKDAGARINLGQRPSEIGTGGLALMSGK